MLSTDTRHTAVPTNPTISADTKTRRGAEAGGGSGQTRRGHIVQPGSPWRGKAGPRNGGNPGTVVVIVTSPPSRTQGC
ncbi:hypothetical protein MBOE_04610 [Mycolicibacterium boenickei]|uniref:Uncharacterized protein n=1 Tax=Mycolicibacterium boenickei TaxID=146017 RepID=A0ABN5Z3Q5_9MYCO|nr:hypothetical protein MBOE_04610 [Mycolicibacterium boenickei]